MIIVELTYEYRYTPLHFVYIVRFHSFRLFFCVAILKLMSIQTSPLQFTQWKTTGRMCWKEYAAIKWYLPYYWFKFIFHAVFWILCIFFFSFEKFSNSYEGKFIQHFLQAGLSIQNQQKATRHVFHPVLFGVFDFLSTATDIVFRIQ